MGLMDGMVWENEYGIYSGTGTPMSDKLKNIKFMKQDYFELYWKCHNNTSACDAADLSCESCVIHRRLCKIEEELKSVYNERVVSEWQEKCKTMCKWLKSDNVIS